MRRIRVNPSHDELLPFPGWKLPVTAHMSTGCLLASLGGRDFGVSVFVADGLDIRSSGSQINLGERDMVLPRPRRNLHLCHHGCSTHDPISATLRWPRTEAGRLLSNGSRPLGYFMHLLQWVPSGGH